MMFSPLRQLVRRMHSALRRGRPSQARGGRLRSYRPRIDTLEEREVPTLWTVTNLLDNVAGSLRAEVFQAQNGDTVQFADGLQGQITLTTGEIAINHRIDIEGLGADVIQVSGNLNGRVFNVAANQTVSISSLTIKDGRLTGIDIYGGGVLNAGTLTLNDCVVSDNSDGTSADARGGGALNVNVLTLNRCTFTNNTSIGGGGGIWNNGLLTINGSHIVDNTAGSSGSLAVGGGGIVNYFATLTATDSNISDNTAAGYGGGLDNRSAVSASLTGCTVTNNTAPLGGGIFNGAPLTINGSNIVHNTASVFGGGGIYSGSTLTITGSTIANNSAASLMAGGGLETGGGVTVLTNDTIAGNVAGTGGGIYNFASGAGLTAVSCTIADNSASGNGGGLDVAVTSIATLRNTLVAQNTAATGNDIFGAVVPTSDYNLVGDGNGLSGLIDGVNGNQVGFYGTIDPLLDPNGLQDNGGPTQTIALLAGSPALNVGAPDLLGSSDQRGVLRSGSVNIGAYQASATAFVLATPDTATAGVPFDVTVTAEDPFMQTAVGYTGTVHFASTDGQALLPGDYTFTGGDAGQHTFTGAVTLETAGNQIITATDTGTGSITGSGTVTVIPAATDHLLFLQQPTDTAAGQTISPAVMVAVVDPFGNIVAGDNSDTVTLSIGINPGGGTLSGTLTVTVVNGVATFDDLSIDQPGVGYTLHATVGGSLPDIDSDPFTVTA